MVGASKAIERTAAGRRWRTGGAERRRIARLDPEADHVEIARSSLQVLHGNRRLVLAMFTIAFMKQVAVPAMARILWRRGTGDIIRDTALRNDDTILFFGQLLDHGPDSPEGIAWIERMNEIHAHFPIRNDDALYTLSTLALDPAAVALALGARPFTPAELEAHWRFWRAVAQRQHLNGIPTTRAGMQQWADDYERREFAPSTAGRAVAEALAEDFAARVLPGPLRPLGREVLAAISPSNLRRVHSLPDPRFAVRTAVRLAGRSYLDGVVIRPVPLDRSLVRTFGGQRGHTDDPDSVGYRRGCPA
ncbi:oxygenase MpaB family protein [Amycolatopsis benzoatilytica]|uniref:oxygenase MpaB family protein n=1 Tax=Amycolatopsis benzoatilytica TaxID=346045 RepID=UPI00036D80CA|nr:oxygenase MpaB family protein [Amycolatopsis benzoatilytica]